MKCPCKGCDKRYIGCHGKCFDYKEWNDVVQHEKEEIKKQKQYDWTDNYYLPSRAGKKRMQS